MLFRSTIVRNVISLCISVMSKRISHPPTRFDNETFESTRRTVSGVQHSQSLFEEAAAEEFSKRGMSSSSTAHQDAVDRYVPFAMLNSLLLF